MQLHDIEIAPGGSPLAFGDADQPTYASADSRLSGLFSHWNQLSASLRVHANAHGVPALATLLMQGIVC